MAASKTGEKKLLGDILVKQGAISNTDLRDALTTQSHVAEIPAADDLILFSEDSTRFYYGDRSIDKDLIAAVRVLINGAPIAACVSRRSPKDTPASRRAAELEGDTAAAAVIDDRPEGIARDRWDVVIDTLEGTIVVECGAIRERVSQELARAVFDAVKRELERRDRQS